MREADARVRQAGHARPENKQWTTPGVLGEA